MEVFLGTKQTDKSTVSILGSDRRKHMAIFGKSAAAKTTLMRNMIVADLIAGNGLTVIAQILGVLQVRYPQYGAGKALQRVARYSAKCQGIVPKGTAILA